MRLPRITIQQGSPRNSQCGDWAEDEYGDIYITISPMARDSYVAVAIHEIIEKLLCDRARVEDGAVTKFDYKFERERAMGLQYEDAEAGDDHRAPYREQHQAATFVERAVCGALGLTWEEHSSNIP